MTTLTRIVLLQDKGINIKYHFDKRHRIWVDNIEGKEYKLYGLSQMEAHDQLKELLGE